MKILKKIILFILLLLTVLGAGGYFFIYTKGRQLLEERISLALNHDVRIGTVVYDFPTHIKFHKILIDGISPADEIEIDIDLQYLYNKQELHISRILLLRPSLLIKKGKDGRVRFLNFNPNEDVKELAEIKVSSMENNSANELTIGDRNIPVIVEQLIIQKGNLQFIDEREQTKKSIIDTSQLHFNDVNLSFAEFYFPLRSEKIYYSFFANLISESDPIAKVVRSEGWVNAVDKDMQGKVNFKRFDGSPILEANLSAENNKLNVEGSVDIQNIWKIKKIDDGLSKLGEFLSENLTSTGVGVDVKFAFETEMDNFQIENIPFSGNIVTGTP